MTIMEWTAVMAIVMLSGVTMVLLVAFMRMSRED
jgi:hypothetical protein